MKKIGFTLAELLITLGIIGIVAALLVTATSTLTPDKNKVLCLKAYDTISNTIKNLVSDSSIYPACKNPDDAENNLKCQDYPLFNTNQPRLNRDLNKALYSGDKKLCSLIAYSMGVTEGDINCSDTPYEYNEASFNQDFDANLSFITQNGMQWRIVPQVASSAVVAAATNTYNATYQTDIYVDVNGSKAPNCIYNSDSCNKPDRFKFMVDATGRVYPADPFSEQYIASRKSFLKKQYDIADNSTVAINLPSNNRNFIVGKCKVQAANEEREESNPPTPFITVTYTGIGEVHIVADTSETDRPISTFSQYNNFVEMGKNESSPTKYYPTINQLNVEIQISNGAESVLSSPVKIIRKSDNLALIECDKTCTKGFDWNQTSAKDYLRVEGPENATIKIYEY